MKSQLAIVFLNDIIKSEKIQKKIFFFLSEVSDYFFTFCDDKKNTSSELSLTIYDFFGGRRRRAGAARNKWWHSMGGQQQIFWFPTLGENQPGGISLFVHHFLSYLYDKKEGGVH